MNRLGILVVLLGLFVILPPGDASAQCSGCTDPCNDHVKCSSEWGPYMDCRNVATCGGCVGWYCEAPMAAADQKKAEPFNLRYVLTAVTITKDGRSPLDTQIASIALDDRKLAN